MKRFHLEQSKTKIYTPQAGLALIGHAVNKFTDLPSSTLQPQFQPISAE